MPTNFTVYYETSKSQKSSNLKVCTLKNLKNSKVNVKAAKTCQPEQKKVTKKRATRANSKNSPTTLLGALI